MKGLFSEFSNSSKEEWIASIVKDLKGRPLEDLNWQLEKDLKAEPFYTAQESPYRAPLKGNLARNAWKIGEDFHINDLKASNAEMLNALENGVNSPRIFLIKACQVSDLAILLAKLIPSYLFLRFKIKTADAHSIALIRNLYNYFSQHGQDSKILEGGFEFENQEVSKELATQIKDLFPLFDFVVNGKKHFKKVEEKTAEIYGLLQDLDRKIANGYDPTSLRVSLSIGNSFFVEIAKIRSLKLLWYHLLEAYGFKKVALKIDAYAGVEELLEDTNRVKIQVTTQAMAASIAGVDTLTINPSSATDSRDFQFTKRIARNVQHLLITESYFDRVVDPIAGSYYVEQLTELYSQKVWELFSVERPLR